MQVKTFEGHNGLKAETGVKTHIWDCDSENDDNNSIRKEKLVRRQYYSSNGMLGRSISRYKHTTTT